MSTDKYAQRRSVVRQIGRALNPMEHLRYRFDEYKEMFDEIEEIDSSMRQKALGQKDELRDLLHEARMAMKQRKFPSVVYYAWKIVNSIDGVFDEVKNLDILKTKYLKEQYGRTDLLPSQIREMDEALKQKSTKSNVRFPKAAKMEILLRAAATPDADLITKGELISSAGPVQWIKENIPSFEGMKVDLMDRVFRNKTHKQREAARQAMRIAERAYSSINNVFEKLDSHRTDFSSYIDEANKAKNMFDEELSTLSKLYQDHFSHIVPEVKEESTPAAPREAPPAPRESSVEQPEVVPDIPVETPQDETIEVGTDELIVDPDMVPQSDTEQLSFDFPQPHTEEELEQQHVAASEIVSLIDRSKVSLASGHRGVAIALLARASEICDNFGAEESSSRLLEIAQSIAK